MAGNMVETALNAAYTYLTYRYGQKEIQKICEDLSELANSKTHRFSACDCDLAGACSYENIQTFMSNLNEKESIRKSKGVYYTPSDVVRFILYNTLRGSEGSLKSNKLNSLNLKGLSYKNICMKKTIFDPTCGAGEFLLHCLDMKFDLLAANIKNITAKQVETVVSTIYGNDVNNESIIITKIRLYLCAVDRYGIKLTRGLAAILNHNFFNYDYVCDAGNKPDKYDIIVGNPPYVETSKSGLNPPIRFGNIYANVLHNAAGMLNVNGAFGFIVPLSYVSTPRMQGIREILAQYVPEQYILSYADRPDCLFTSVHQKLCIVIGVKKACEPVIYTGNYQYWYKDERGSLFKSTKVIKNTFKENSFVPKLGTGIDNRVYKKVVNTRNRVPFSALQKEGTGKVHLNMRATFWIKAFLNEHDGAEYKTYHFENDGAGCYAMCLLNSSLFWWYWVCVSDCWHITRKELSGFMTPVIDDYTEVIRLANLLENELEKTKVYVGTKQVEYEYKHKDCVYVINQIDDYINKLFGLTDEENEYIQNFAYRYRVGGGAEGKDASEEGN
jgi:type I restriction-modification system DNA methylase subunit